MDDAGTAKRSFTLEEARRLLPEVRQLTEGAYKRMSGFLEDPERLPDEGEVDAETLEEVNEIVSEWVGGIISLGCEIKGLWLVDFDCGHGYYCWKYPEESIEHYHSYEDGYSGRMKIV